MGATAAVLLASVAAWGQSRFPAANRVVFGPSNPNFVVVRTSFGILPSTDDGLTWGLVCNQAAGLQPTNWFDPALAVSADDSLLVGTANGGTNGLSVSSDVGCNWDCVGNGLANQNVVDLADRPDTPSSAVALAVTWIPTDSGASDAASTVFGTTDNGKTWTQLGGPLDPAIEPTTIGVARSDPNRLYVAATRGAAATRSASLFVSVNGGTTWVEEPIPAFDPGTEQAIFIAGVDATDGDRVYLRSSSLVTGGRVRLYARDAPTAGAGPTFSMASGLPDQGGFDVPAMEEYDPAGELLAFAISSDGSKLYAGTVSDGLWVASSSDLAFTQKNTNVDVRCLATRGAELWACADEVNGFVVGSSVDDGATFAKRMQHTTSIAGPVACQANPSGPLGCGATANAAACAAAYANLCGVDDFTHSCGGPGVSDDGGSDGGTSDGGVSGDASLGGHEEPSVPASCRCSLVGGGAKRGPEAALALAALAMMRRRGRGR
jgi:hypothetical protein